MSKHTPGPWHLGRPDRDGEDAHMCEVMTKYTTASGAGTLSCYDIICRTWSPHQLVASVRLTRSECQANARLIAAAPELLEALRHLLTAVTFADPPKEFNGALCHEARVPVGFVDAARAAIAKAKEVKP